MTEPSPARVILLVDDNRTLTRLLSLLISRQLGHQVLVAHDCAEARRLASRTPPDVLVVDLNLPDGDGLELAHEVRLANRDLRLLVMSAELPRTLLFEARETFAFCALLGKPFESREVLEAMRGALARPSSRPQPARVSGPPAPPAAPPPADWADTLDGVEDELRSLFSQLRLRADDPQAVRALVAGPLESLLTRVLAASAAIRPRIGR